MSDPNAALGAGVSLFMRGGMSLDEAVKATKDLLALDAVEQTAGAEEDLRAENRRPHDEIRSLNGQIDGLTRVLAGHLGRIARCQKENDELKARLREVVG